MKETQKQYIARIEKELEQVKSELDEYKELCNKLNAEILQMQERADKDYSNSSDYRQMNKEIEFLKTRNKMLESNNTTLNGRIQKFNERENSSNIQELIIEKQHNERGAGRKTRFTDQEKETVKMYRLQGKTIKELAEMFCCSVGLIHKLINE